MDKNDQRRQMLENLREVRSFDDIVDMVFCEGVQNLGFAEAGLSSHITGHGMNIILIRASDPEAYTRKVKLLNEYAKSCAPLFEEPVVTKDGFVLLASTWRGDADSEDVLPYDPKAASWEQKSRFLSELDRIADGGLEHPYVTFGYAHWMINVRTQSIVLTNWEDADFMAEGAREHYLEGIRDLLEL